MWLQFVAKRLANTEPPPFLPDKTQSAAGFKICFMEWRLK
jgi:hypothetical protein